MNEEQPLCDEELLFAEQHRLLMLVAPREARKPERDAREVAEDEGELLSGISRDVEEARCEGRHISKPPLRSNLTGKVDDLIERLLG
jgi:hypothetical protein